MSTLHHWSDDNSTSFEELRDSYIKSVDNDEMASLNEIRNVHEDDAYLTAEEFCKKYGLGLFEIEEGDNCIYFKSIPFK